VAYVIKSEVVLAYAHPSLSCLCRGRGGTGHGFTGLLYAYTPQGVELQYFCRSL
jgi:hypothetical protein